MKTISKILMFPIKMIWAIIFSIICLFIIVIGIIVNLFHGISPKTSLESLLYHIRIGKEEEES